MQQPPQRVADAAILGEQPTERAAPKRGRVVLSQRTIPVGRMLLNVPAVEGAGAGTGAGGLPLVALQANPQELVVRGRQCWPSLRT